MLWISIHCPQLPLEVFGGDAARRPVAVLEGQRLVHVGAAARAAGVRPGMSPAAARALCPGLGLRERAPASEGRALRRLAAWCLQFTPAVSVQAPAAVLLEVGGSLAFFGGLERLSGGLRGGLGELGYGYRLGVAPTPTGAWLLSRAGDERPVTRLPPLEERLSSLPAALLVADARQRQALAGLGIETLGDCLSLPRSGLARRLGERLLHDLDRALGRVPDPRPRYQPPGRYESRIELPSEVALAGELHFALNRLTQELCGFLRGTGNGVQSLRIALEHRRSPATGLKVGTVAPSRDPAHLMDLLRERLERVELPAPVLALGLRAAGLQRLDPRPMALLEAEDAGASRRQAQLLERLAARLGASRIRGLRPRPEHRPERAWQYMPPGQRVAVEAGPERPLWLLPEPERLALRGARPLWDGPLTLEQGPECIESGWWDGGDVSRDYYVARNDRGSRLWVFRERRPPRRWYLHGIFG